MPLYNSRLPMNLAVSLLQFGDVYRLAVAVGYCIRQYLELERALRLFVGKEFFVVLINPFDGG